MKPVIHEGVTTRALERKGIVSDRCKLNRQIKADNALLRELKATVRKLTNAVKVAIPAVVEALLSMRAHLVGNIICFTAGRRSRKCQAA